MHELFLSAYVANDDRFRALGILQGYCGMNPQSLLRRRLMFEGPRGRNLTGIDPNFIARQPPAKSRLWKELHEQLIRQSYVITLIYEVSRDDFEQPEIVGVGAAPAKLGPVLECDGIPGILRWADLPDPAGSRPVNSRMAVNIADEKNLCATLQSNGHKFIRENIQECYRLILGNIVFCLGRYLQFPRGEQDVGDNGQPTPNRRLPAFECLAPFDADNKWIITARVEVLNGNDPEQMQKGIDELMAIKSDFEGVFDFQVIDRHTFDTRVK
jgi:mediator of RNA polymerase II transcription subunit 18